VRALALVAILAGGLAGGDAKVRVADEVDTVGGTLRVSREARRHRVTLRGRTVLEDRESGTVAIVGREPKEGAARLILLELGTGGSGCPAFHRVLDVSGAGQVTASAPFGNCSPLARARWEGGDWIVDLPRFGGAAAESWTYSGGALSKRP
jgi:hypothetical protein